MSELHTYIVHSKFKTIIIIPITEEVENLGPTGQLLPLSLTLIEDIYF